jgi:hypothetical protein
MKHIALVVIVALLASCNNTATTENETATPDTTVAASDTTQCCDSTATPVNE